MPLQQLADYFNDRFGEEHQSNFKPITLENGLVSGLFGPVKISSQFSSLRQTTQPESICGQMAQIRVSTYDPLLLKDQQLDCLLGSGEQNGHFESIVNFDRLSRTVHMLNFLPISHLDQALFLEVDPRHILSIKKDHGAYFEEVIHKCGLETRNIVIVTGLFDAYASKYYQALQQGLDNYRHRGYQIGLRFVNVGKSEQLLNYAKELTPDYIIFSARNLEEQQEYAALQLKLAQVKASIAEHGGKLVLQHIHERKMAQLAREAEVDLVEGNFYRTIPYNYRKHLKLPSYNPAVFSYGFVQQRQLIKIIEWGLYKRFWFLRIGIEYEKFKKRCCYRIHFFRG